MGIPTEFNITWSVKFKYALIMEENNEILGCFVSCQSTLYDENKSEIERIKEQKIINEECKLFRSYIWGESGINNILKKLKHKNYGKDIELILLEFYIKPAPYLLQNLKEVSSYRKKEKSI